MTLEFGLLITIAEISGIFVGFGALIGATRRNEVDPYQLTRIRSVVTVGLLVIVAALVPVLIDLYGVTDHNLWFISSIIFLALNWVVIILSLRHYQRREFLLDHTFGSRKVTILLGLVLEVPMQTPLYLTLLGWFPSLEPAFYITALVFNLFQAAIVLTQIVHSQEPQKVSE
jgi:hypothetical protein